MESNGLHYNGSGVSEGEERALKASSILPGGSPSTWKNVKQIFQTISAKVEGEIPCCNWVDGMVENVCYHNAKEYFSL